MIRGARPQAPFTSLLAALEASKHKGVPDVNVFRKTADAVLPTCTCPRSASCVPTVCPHAGLAEGLLF
jgi:hypothetical protein